MYGVYFVPSYHTREDRFVSFKLKLGSVSFFSSPFPSLALQESLVIRTTLKVH